MKELHILIIDDDDKLRDLLVKYFSGYSMNTSTLEDGLNAAKTVVDIKPDLVVLDLMMPGKDGFEVLKEIRESSNVPVIMLTAKGEDSEKIVGLELGADDYVAKPFNARELLARIRAVMRRGAPKKPNQQSEEFLEKGGLILDSSRMILRIKDNEHELSSAEFSMLKAFMTHADKILSRDQLMTMTRGSDSTSFDRTVDVHVSKLRAILKKYPNHKSRIKTVWGEGYRFLSD